LGIVGEDESRIVDTFLHLKNGGKADFQKMSEDLLNWSEKWI
jgi:hypothetical protein